MKWLPLRHGTHIKSTRLQHAIDLANGYKWVVKMLQNSIGKHAIKYLVGEGEAVRIHEEVGPVG